LDAVIANGENSAPGGRGITAASGSALLSVVDFLTLGNHAFDARRARGVPIWGPRVIRTTNAGEGLLGRGWGIFEAAGVRVGVANVQGRVFMRQDLASPFEAAERAVSGLETSGVGLVLVDVHAEATSEKQAMDYHLDGRAQAVVRAQKYTRSPSRDL
jgi:calcineurin-like phosphoesterase